MIHKKKPGIHRPISKLSAIKIEKRRNLIRMIAVELVSLLILGIFLLWVQGNLTRRTYCVDSYNKLEMIEQRVQEKSTSRRTLLRFYDDLYVSKAESVALWAQTVQEYSDDVLDEFAECMNAENITIADRQGNIIATSNEQFDLKRARFRRLFAAFYSSADAEPITIRTKETGYRFYSAKISEKYLAIVVINLQELRTILDSATSTKDVLKNISVGVEGFSFSVNRLDYTFTDYPDESLIGKDALSHGFNISAMSADFAGTVSIDGKEYYCVGRPIGDDSVFCAIPLREMYSSTLTTVLILLVAFLIMITLTVAYANLVLEESFKDVRSVAAGVDSSAVMKKMGRKINSKILPINVIAAITVLVLSFYMQTMFCMTQQSVSNNVHLKEVKQSLENSDISAYNAQLYYSEQYITKCKTGAFILNHMGYKEPDQAFMRRLRDALHVTDVNLFGLDYRMKASSSDLWDFELSSDPNSQSYPFRSILDGTTLNYVQPADYDDSTYQYVQYTGQAIQDQNHHLTGMIQICVSPDYLNRIMIGTDIQSVLKGVSLGSSSFAFAIRKDDHTFLYYPDERMIGRDALANGIKEYQLADNVSEFNDLNGTQYYTASLEMSDYYTYVATPTISVMASRFPVSIITTAAYVVCSALILLLIGLSTRHHVMILLLNVETEPISPIADTENKHRTRSILLRGTRFKDWDELSSGQKLLVILQWAIMLFSIVATVIIIRADSIFRPESMLLYILNGNWQRSVNIFSVTKCILTAVIVLSLEMVAHTLLEWCSESMNARGMTTCRLLNSALRFGCILYIIFNGLKQVGVDTSTLMASAGILSLVVGMGAQSLISDIIAGLFIVFENEFQVGDIITIDDFRGVVLSIGIRTSKIKDDNGNIKIVSNRSVSGVLNMTQELTRVRCIYSVEYSDDLNRIEEILKQELPLIPEKVPAIKKGPSYSGVEQLNDSSVDILIVFYCLEADRPATIPRLNREIKLMFDRHGITIPFPQIVLNERK